MSCYKNKKCLCSFEVGFTKLLEICLPKKRVFVDLEDESMFFFYFLAKLSNNLFSSKNEYRDYNHIGFTVQTLM